MKPFNNKKRIKRIFTINHYKSLLIISTLAISTLALSGCSNSKSGNQTTNQTTARTAHQNQNAVKQSKQYNRIFTNHLFDQPREFDLQAHRGGLGLVTESSIASFTNALKIGVTTLEMDTQITKDGVAVVTHDRQVSDKKCLDTSPVTANDPLFPYVGKYINQLTLEQVKTLNCGSLRLAAYPNQKTVEGSKIPTLRQVLELIHQYKAYNVMLNIETKVEAGAPEQTAPQDIFVETVLKDIHESGLSNQVMIQSFDWGAIMKVREMDPTLPIVALTNGEQFLQTGVEGKSPWLGGIDIDDFNGDLIAAVNSFGADVLSPVHGNPQNGTIKDKDYVPYTTPEMIEKAKLSGIKIIPWTVSDKPTLDYFIGLGVDGIITDRPDIAREVLEARGIELPKPIKI